MKVDKLGSSSVRYGLALFGETGPAKATGFVVHVFVNRETGRPVPIPERLRNALEALQLGVYLHGSAGDLAASRLGQPSVMASDIIEELPQAFSSLAL